MSPEVRSESNTVRTRCRPRPGHRCAGPGRDHSADAGSAASRARAAGNRADIAERPARDRHPEAQRADHRRAPVDPDRWRFRPRRAGRTGRHDGVAADERDDHAFGASDRGRGRVSRRDHRRRGGMGRLVRGHERDILEAARGAGVCRGSGPASGVHGKGAETAAHAEPGRAAGRTARAPRPAQHGDSARGLRSHAVRPPPRRNAAVTAADHPRGGGGLSSPVLPPSECDSRLRRRHRAAGRIRAGEEGVRGLVERREEDLPAAGGRHNPAKGARCGDQHARGRTSCCGCRAFRNPAPRSAIRCLRGREHGSWRWLLVTTE